MDTANARSITRLGAAWRDDLLLIWRPLLTLSLAVLTWVLVLYVSHAVLQRNSLRLSQAQQLRDAAGARLRLVEEQKLDIQQYQARFIELQGTGLIGAEKRLDWIEAIGAIQSARKLPPLAYEFEAQQPFRVEGGFASGDYQLLGSKMKLHMELLHEMDLLNFLADLRQRAYFSVQDCSIKRLAADTGRPASLSADCTLNWLTLGVPGALAAPARKGP